MVVATSGTQKPEAVDIINANGILINPATEEKQDYIVANNAAIKASLEIIDDWDENDRAKVNPIVGQSGVSSGTGTDDSATQRVSLATDIPLPTGSNNIGKVTLNISTDMEGGGKISVGTTAIEVTFAGTTSSIIISADIDNTGTLYIGESNVTNTGANAMAFLFAGESITIDYDDSSNALFVVASLSSQNFWKGALV